MLEPLRGSGSKGDGSRTAKEKKKHQLYYFSLLLLLPRQSPTCSASLSLSLRVSGGSAHKSHSDRTRSKKGPWERGSWFCACHYTTRTVCCPCTVPKSVNSLFAFCIPDRFSGALGGWDGTPHRSNPSSRAMFSEQLPRSKRASSCAANSSFFITISAWWLGTQHPALVRGVVHVYLCAGSRAAGSGDRLARLKQKHGIDSGSLQSRC